MSDNTMLLVFIFGLPLLLVFFLMIGCFFYYRRERSLTHAERMKALEMGQPLPDDPETAKIKAKAARTLAMKPAEMPSGEKSLANQCYATTGYICGGGFFFAFVVGGPAAYALAAATGAIGVTGMICGTILATREVKSEPPRVYSKPQFDPEAV